MTCKSVKETFNTRIYAQRVQDWIPDVNADDLLFLCNRSASIYQQIEAAGCVDNYRVSRVGFFNRVSSAYSRAKAGGCCGYTDVVLKNPVTGNKFAVGFNYGH